MLLLIFFVIWGKYGYFDDRLSKRNKITQIYNEHCKIIATIDGKEVTMINYALHVKVLSDLSAKITAYRISLCYHIITNPIVIICY